MTLAAAPLLACSTPVRSSTDPSAAGAASLTDDSSSAALQAGPFHGHRSGGVVAWHGIRYARASRFGLPAVEALPVDPVDCADFGATAAQAKGAGGSRSESDDPFFLNVWSPAADGKRRPVLVWIHGGGFQTGSGSLYVGDELAGSGDIVVVTFNYRLGAIGFSDFSTLGIPNNRGIHDQIAALRWVQDNIALFGGDPGKVTVAGESPAGWSRCSVPPSCRAARSTCCMTVTSPRARRSATGNFWATTRVVVRHWRLHRWRASWMRRRRSPNRSPA
jgi:para-nitrobenzyl esterase